MRTVKQVSELTGISIRTLHYYDEIGLLKPSKLTESGYRLYDKEALKTLQQILFFKELEIPLKDVKEIMLSQSFNKMEALKKQRELLKLKRKRLDDLICLIDKTIEGEDNMSFNEFDMTEYFNVLEKFKEENTEYIVKNYGSIEKYNELIEKCKDNEEKIGEMAVKQYGSIKRYARAVESNLNSSKLFELEEGYSEFKNDCLNHSNSKLTELFNKLANNKDKSPKDKEVQEVARNIDEIAKREYKAFCGINGDEHWYYMIRLFSIYPGWIEKVDKEYGVGASKFIGESLKVSLGDKRPKGEILYEELTKDLTKDPTSKEIQKIVEEISNEDKKNAKIYNIDQGENHIGTMADFYLKNEIFISSINKQYGEGAAKFIGEAFKFYSENK